MVVDAGNSPAHADQLIAGLSRFGPVRQTYLAITHWHWDHVFGASAFAAPMFAHEQTRRLVAHMAQLEWSDEALDQRVRDGTEIAFCRDMIRAEWPNPRHPRIRVPDVTFTNRIEFNLGGVVCAVQHVGGDHSPDSCVMHIPEDRVLFLGDCLSPDLHHGPPRYTMEKVVPLLDALLAFDADQFLYGHDLEPVSRTEFDAFAALLRSVGLTVQRLGLDRTEILRALPPAEGTTTDQDVVELTDAFLAGA